MAARKKPVKKAPKKKTLQSPIKLGTLYKTTDDPLTHPDEAAVPFAEAGHDNYLCFVREMGEDKPSITTLDSSELKATPIPPDVDFSWLPPLYRDSLAPSREPLSLGVGLFYLSETGEKVYIVGGYWSDIQNCDVFVGANDNDYLFLYRGDGTCLNDGEDLVEEG